MIVYANRITPRLQYVADFIGKQITGGPFQLTDDAFYFNDYNGPKINYGYETISNDELLIVNYPLLFEESIKKQNISCFRINGGKAFFKSEGDYPFDIFAAVFYLLSRYEEYLPHEKDEYGRYAHENSVAFREGFLNIPLVNIWIEDFRKALKEKFSMLNPGSSRDQYSTFNFLPTYDIDEAYAFKHKSLARTMGGMVKSIVNGEWSMVNERIKVLRNKKEDPYDVYQWMDKLHDQKSLKPIYFFHVAEKKGKYDKNIEPSHPVIQQLIKQHAAKYQLGIHPSWASGDDKDLLAEEINTLESASGQKIRASRQHYIRFTLPHTFRRLISVGITDDYSMGYGSINGFRASVASPFYWYDLKQEKQTNLRLHPFCFMEANSFFEQKVLPQRAYEEMMHYYNAVKAVNGILITIWHNSFLGDYRSFAGWKDIYEEFVSAVNGQR
ncbi:MAG TPA: polysaccharide deacetylase family protein [Chitinophagaceae bacterium]|nr:polysaccharide deacetylase family protein [Chitinophagaceae bacterium]